MMKSFAIIFLLISTGRCRILKDCVCGVPNIFHGRIVNGQEATPHKYPWMAAMLTSSGIQMCGGAIIGDRTIISAGHCVFYVDSPLTTTWLLGSHNISHAKKLPQSIYSIYNIELHPKFVNSSASFDDFDLALITLDRKIKFNEHVKPICLPPINGEEAFYGKKVVVAGWGKMSEGFMAVSPDVLMETKVLLKSFKKCKQLTNGLKGYNRKSMICGFLKNTDACQGDSGGPLFVEYEPNRYQIIGVVSYGKGCATSFPGIYAKVTEAETLDWIHSYIHDSGSNVCDV